MRQDQVASGAVAWETPGNIVTPSYTPGVQKPAQPFGLFMAGFETPGPRTLSLNVTRSDYAGTGFPPGSYGGQDRALSFVAGLLDNDGQWGSIQQKAACFLRYGIGNIQNEVWFDWIPGTYQLPPVSYVECGVMLWGPGGLSSWTPLKMKGLRFSAATGPGVMPGAHVPTVSDAFQLPPVNTIPGYRLFNVPIHARAVECMPAQVFEPDAGDQVQGQMFEPSSNYGGLGDMFYRNFVAGVVYPPWTPITLTGATQLKLSGGQETWTRSFLRFYLQL